MGNSSKDTILSVTKIDYKRYIFYGTLFSIPPFLIFYPVRTAKTIQQSSLKKLSALQALKIPYNINGITGIYRGCSYFFVSIIFARMLNFGFYDALREWSTFGTGPKISNMTQSILYGGMSAVFSNALVVPLDVLTQQLQVHQRTDSIPLNHSSTQKRVVSTLTPVSRNMSVLQLIKAEGGLSFLYRGFTATLMSGVPFFTIYFASYEGCRNILPKFHPIFKTQPDLPRQDANSTTILGGVIAATLATMISAPCDVVKTKIQVSRKSITGSKLDLRWLTMLKGVVRDQGYKGLWVGSTTRLTALAPIGALNFYIFNWVKRLSRIED